jgi:hypothetical protein
MTIGILKFGLAPDGRMGTPEQITQDLMPADADPEKLREYKESAPLLWSMLNLGEADAIKVLEGDVSDSTLRRAVWNFRVFMLHVRYGFRRKFFVGNNRPPSTNPLTMFGAAKHVRFQERFRKLPIRITPAQIVGCQFAHALLIAHVEEQMEQVYEFFMQWFPYFLKSDACAQWIAQTESEENKHKK